MVILKEFTLQTPVIKPNVLVQVWGQCVNALEKEDLFKFKNWGMEFGKKMGISSNFKNLWIRFLTLGSRPDGTTLQNKQ